MGIIATIFIFTLDGFELKPLRIAGTTEVIHHRLKLAEFTFSQLIKILNPFSCSDDIFDKLTTIVSGDS